MARPRSNPEYLNVVSRIDQLLPRHDYALLMLERGVAAISPAALAALEKAGQIKLDYVQIANLCFVLDTPENEHRMAAAEKARVDRLVARAATAPDWVINRIHADNAPHRSPAERAANPIQMMPTTQDSKSASEPSPP